MGTPQAESCWQLHACAQPNTMVQLTMAPRAAGRCVALLHHCASQHRAKLAAPATELVERQQPIATFCTLNILKEVIAIHNLNLMGNSGKWD